MTEKIEHEAQAEPTPSRFATPTFLLSGCLVIFGLFAVATVRDLWLTRTSMLLDSQPDVAAHLARPVIAETVREASNGNSSVSQILRGPDGLHVVLVQDNQTGKETVMFASPKGHLLMDGFTWGSATSPLVKRVKESAPIDSDDPDPSFSGEIPFPDMKKIHNLRAIETGTGTRIITVFYDPLGDESLQMPRLIGQPADFLVRWIPVSVGGGEGSLGLAAAIYAGGTYQSLIDVFTGRLTAASARQIDRDTVEEANRALLKITHGRHITPMTVGYVNGKYRYVSHIPSNFSDFLTAIAPSNIE